MKIQILDINYGYDSGGYPVIHLFGNTESGQNVIKYITGFLPYLFVWHNDINQVQGFLSGLGKSIGIPMWFEKVDKFKPMGYQSKTTKMLKITTKNPKDVAIIRDFCKHEGYTVYEADILFSNRFLIDHDLGGMDWVIVPESNYVSHDDIIQVPGNTVAPMKSLSIDIECLPNGDSMPTPDKEPIILISLAFDPPWRNQETIVMVAKDIPCSRKDVIVSDNERSMLNKLSFIFEEYNPDIVAGYNSNSFDLPYITSRARILGVQLRMTRDGRAPWCKTFMNKTSVTMTGRIVLDMLPVLRKDIKHQLKSYKLANVAKEVLHSEKLDVPAGKMRELWNDPTGIIEFIKYSRRDAWLVMKLVKELKTMDRYFALSKASGTLPHDVVSGDQSIMLEFMHLRGFTAANRVVGLKPSDAGDFNDRSPEYQGAYVSDPEPGLHDHVILTDMQSLYPSEIIANNICPTTVIIDEECSEILIDPNGKKFAGPSVAKGILPAMLDEILRKRKEAKIKMKEAKTDKERDMYDSIQYSYKILANSAYGFAGYTRSRVFNIQVASAVTAYGRDTIKEVRNRIENEIGELSINDKKIKLHVIYTDTDSAYVKLISSQDITKDDANAMGIKVAEIISKPMPYPMKLNYEGYARRALFLAKKRYAMYMIGEKIPIKAKGIETVRRDWCNLTSRTLTRCLELILIDGNTEAALDHARKALQDVRTSNKDIIDDLILTRTLTMKPENYKQMQPHAELVKRLESQGIHKYVLGDRIPFVIVNSGKRNDKMSMKAEDPEIVLNKNLRIDADYYLQKQLLPPLTRIFESFGIGEEDLLTKTRQRSLLSW